MLKVQSRAQTVKCTCFSCSDLCVTHVQSLVVLMADDSSQEVLVLCWQALVAVAGSIPKEMMPSYVRTLKEAVSTAKEKERRKRRPPPLRVAGFCLPKALQPVLPIFLQGVLQVWLCTYL